MELDWSTFVLEIINFLVLMWILKRFLYQPVLAVIARRQAAIDASMQTATALRQQAQSAREQYDTRLQEWQKEREHKVVQLQQEIAVERDRQLQQLQEELAQARAKAQVLAERESVRLRDDIQAQAVHQATQFAAKFLQPFASAGLQTQMLERAAQQLSAQDSTRRAALRTRTDGGTASALIATAYALDDAQRQRWTSLVTDIHGSAIAVRFVEDPALLAGINITLGAWVLKASLRDELQAFAELAL